VPPLSAIEQDKSPSHYVTLIALTLPATSLTALPAHQRLHLFGQVLDLYSVPY
jgi:hypothetical protein